MADSKNVLNATDSTFDTDVMGAPQLSVVDFWAEWCGPCRQLGPVIEQLAEEYAGRAKVFKLNVDDNPNTPGRFGIRGIPTVLFFKGGKLVDQIVGNHPKATISSVMDKHI